MYVVLNRRYPRNGSTQDPLAALMLSIKLEITLYLSDDIILYLEVFASAI